MRQPARPFQQAGDRLQSCDKTLCRSDDAYVDVLDFADFRLINVRHDLFGVATEIFALECGETRVQATACDNQQICVLDDEVRVTSAHDAREAEVHRVVMRQQVCRLPSQKHWDMIIFRPGDQAVRASCQLNAIADQQQWPL